jgi:hypothetical protein
MRPQSEPVREIRSLDEVAPFQSASQEKQSHDDRKNGEPKESRNRRLMVNVGYVQHKRYQKQNQRVRHPMKR